MHSLRICVIEWGYEEKRPHGILRQHRDTARILLKMRYLCLYRECCDKPTDEGPLRVKRMSDCPIRRGIPNRSNQKSILQDQQYCCFYCNGIKTNLMFKDVDDARTHITSRWGAKGYTDLPPMSINLRAETPLAKVLQPNMPTKSVVRTDVREGLCKQHRVQNCQWCRATGGDGYQ